MAQVKKLSWLALLVPVALCCAAPLLVVGGAAAVAAVVGFACSGLGLAAAVLVVGGGIAAGMVLRRRRQTAANCCDLSPQVKQSLDAPESVDSRPGRHPAGEGLRMDAGIREKEQEPVLRP